MKVEFWVLKNLATGLYLGADTLKSGEITFFCTDEISSLKIFESENDAKDWLEPESTSRKKLYVVCKMTIEHVSS